jgi:hypothetical protein
MVRVLDALRQHDRTTLRLVFIPGPSCDVCYEPWKLSRSSASAPRTPV